MGMQRLESVSFDVLDLVLLATPIGFVICRYACLHAHDPLSRLRGSPPSMNPTPPQIVVIHEVVAPATRRGGCANCVD